MAMRLSVRWKKDRKLQFRLALFTGGRSGEGHQQAREQNIEKFACSVHLTFYATAGM